MAESVQWIRLKVGMFDGHSFKKIKRAKIGGVSYRDKLTAVWFELLDLAGKGNANGYLVDNNEIPYRSFEDIAFMLDREEKEIELCMQFFINEKMVEIIDDIFCLTNFMQYQNQEGLEKIREQKRLSQARWRERKRQGLIGKSVESTVGTTDHLLSNSYSSSFSSIFDYWNSKDIIKHRELTEEISKSIDKALKKYSEEEIKCYIGRYAEVLKDTEYFFSYKWTLAQFLSRKEGISSFADDGDKWVSYQSNKNRSKAEEKESSFDADEFFSAAVKRTYGEGF
jgi:predicted phage replisome organizer